MALIRSEPGLVATPKTIGSGEIHAAIERLAAGIFEHHASERSLLLLGIANGGVELARRLARILSKRSASTSPKADSGSKSKTSNPSPIASHPRVSVGTLDISFHRDDIGRHPIPKEFSPTHIPVDVHGAMVILVDDVLFSGRTVKAALDELFDHGRPTKVELAVLVDRGGRLLPVGADYIGLSLVAGSAERVMVTLDPKDPARDAVTVLPTNAPKKPKAKKT